MGKLGHVQWELELWKRGLVKILLLSAWGGLESPRECGKEYF
jgi:hypothetical protein